MSDHIDLDDLLRADPADPGCQAGVEIVDQYVELDLATNGSKRRPTTR
jgi:hypothetical protein